MKVIDGLGKPQRHLKKTVVTIGAFDGVHRGHQKIIKEVVRSAKRIKGQSVVVTFDPHPSRVLSQNPQLLLLSLPDKLCMLESFGIDACVVINFNRSFSHLPPRDFVTKILIHYLKAKLVIIGFNYVFGRGRKGNAKLLSEMGREHGFIARQVKPVKIRGEIVSSTRIRELVRNGDVLKANSFLGRPYEITGKVKKGESRGHLIGHPTANLDNIQGILPSPGVYAGTAVVGGHRYKAALNLGWRPTFSRVTRGVAVPKAFGTKGPTAEVHILRFNKNIYGRKVTFGFIKKIRDEIAFDSIEELRKQIEIDLKKIHSIGTVDRTTRVTPPQ